MARYTGPQWKISRRLGFSILENGKELNRRAYAPGQHGLNQVDLLTPAERKISEKESWAKRKGQKKPTLKMLREEKNRLTELQTVQRDEFNARREYEWELRTVCSNVDIILNHPHIQEPLPEASQEHSCFR